MKEKTEKEAFIEHIIIKHKSHIIINTTPINKLKYFSHIPFYN